MARRPNANADRQMLLFSAPDVHYLFNAYNRAVHHYNQEVSAAAGGLSAPAAPSTKRLDKARAEFLAAVEALPHGQVRDAYMDEFKNTHVVRYNGPSMRVLDKKIKSTLRKRHAVKSGLAYNPHTVCQDCGQEDAAVRHADGHVACFMCGATQSAIETRDNASRARRKNPSMGEARAMVKKLKSLAKQGVGALKKHRIVYRDNASFTLEDEAYGAGGGDRHLIEEFYTQLDSLFPGDTPALIPHNSDVHPENTLLEQAVTLVNFAVGHIAPLALRTVGLNKEADTLENLATVSDVKTAESAYKAAWRAGSVACDKGDDLAKRAAKAAERRMIQRDPRARSSGTADAAGDIASLASKNGPTKNEFYHADSAAINAAQAVKALVEAYEYIKNDGEIGADARVELQRAVPIAVAYAVLGAATLSPDKTWDIVNEMLQAL